MKKIIFTIVMLSAGVAFADPDAMVNFVVNYNLCMQSKTPESSVFCKNIRMTAADVAQTKAIIASRNQDLASEMDKLISLRDQLISEYNDSCIFVERHTELCNQTIKAKIDEVQKQIEAKKFDQKLADLEAKLDNLMAHRDCEWVSERQPLRCNFDIEAQIAQTRQEIIERKAELLRVRGY